LGPRGAARFQRQEEGWRTLRFVCRQAFTQDRHELLVGFPAEQIGELPGARRVILVGDTIQIGESSAKPRVDEHVGGVHGVIADVVEEVLGEDVGHDHGAGRDIFSGHVADGKRGEHVVVERLK